MEGPSLHSADMRRVYHYLSIKRALPAMAPASGCRLSSHAGSFISEGHGSSLRDGFDGCLSANANPDGCEDNAVFLGRLHISGGHDANSNNEEFHSAIKAIMNGCNSNARLCILDRFNAENFDDVRGSVIFGSGDSRQRELQNGIDELHIKINNTYLNSKTVADADIAKPVMNFSIDIAQFTHVASESKGNKPAKRAFCKRCEKAQDLCICGRFKDVVNNKVKITILQNPKEKQHAVGSVRVALLGLENVVLVDVPEMYTKESFRIRPKIPGSKRSLAGRGGKKLLLNGGKSPALSHDIVPSKVEVLQAQNLLREIFKCQLNNFSGLGRSSWPSYSSGSGHEVHNVSVHDRRLLDGKVCPVGGNVACDGELKETSESTGKGSLNIEDLESLIPPGVALLYPSDKAVELSELLHRINEQELEPPCHLLVLDGTWSKARRIYFENPWLQNLPHYKLSPPSPSLYEGVRKQPKPGCLSTLESIVYALKVLEPENVEGLDGLLGIFDSMVEDQRRCKQMRGCVHDDDM